MARARYAVFDGAKVLRTFPTRGECKAWVTEGMASCEGSERDRYVDMLMQLESGRKSLSYGRLS